MKWFLTQSIWTILLSFLLGALLTWLWYRSRYRKVERSWSTPDVRPTLSGDIEQRDVQLTALRADVAKRSTEISDEQTALAAQSNTLRGERDTNARLLSERDAQLAKLTADHQSALAALRDDHTKAIADLQSTHALTLGTAKKDHEQAMTTLVSSREASDTGAAQQLALLRHERDRAESDLRHRAETAEGELGRIRGELDLAQHRISEQTEGLRGEIEQHVEQIALSKRAADSAQADIARLRAEVDGLRGQMANERVTHQGLAAGFSTLQAAHAALQTTHNDLQSAHDGLQAERQSFVSSGEQSNEELVRLRAQVAAGRESSTELEGLRTRISDRDAEIERLRGRVVDDFERLEGVGPAFHRALHADGIRTYEQLRDADEPRLREAVQKAGLNFAPSLPSWSRQAGYLAAGDDAAHLEYTNDLIAGRDPESAPPTSTVDPEGVDGPDTPLDDLERIEGIGPKISASLQSVGVRSFARLSVAPQTRLRQALEQSGLNYAPSLPTWSEQARLLAAGDVEGFLALVDRLIAGREAK